MADHYISFNKADGINPGNLTAGTSSTASDQVELRMLDGAALTQKDVLLALESFKAYTTTHSVTP